MEESPLSLGTLGEVAKVDQISFRKRVQRQKPSSAPKHRTLGPVLPQL